MVHCLALKRQHGLKSRTYSRALSLYRDSITRIVYYSLDTYGLQYMYVYQTQLRGFQFFQSLKANILTVLLHGTPRICTSTLYSISVSMCHDLTQNKPKVVLAFTSSIKNVKSYLSPCYFFLFLE